MNDVAWALQTARQVGPVHPPEAHAHPIHKLHTGPLHSHVAGRTDHLPSNVPNGSYVLPADVVSGLGESNTMAGFKVAKRMFEGAKRHYGGLPYAGDCGAYGQGDKPYGMASGGFIAREKGHNIGSEALSSIRKAGHVYRGMTHDEYHATLGAGKGIKSTGKYSNASEGTNFAEDPESAESYVNYGRDDPRKTGKPNYLVEARAEGMSRKPDGYYHTTTEVSPTRTWAMHPEDGAIVARPHIPTQKAAFAHGGYAEQGVPVAVAGGEHVLAPHEVTWAGMGDIDAGHRALDEFVLRQRAKTVKTLRKLPGPHRDD